LTVDEIAELKRWIKRRRPLKGIYYRSVAENPCVKTSGRSLPQSIGQPFIPLVQLTQKSQEVRTAFVGLLLPRSSKEQATAPQEQEQEYSDSFPETQFSNCNDAGCLGLLAV
jgi:hypothetical protein